MVPTQSFTDLDSLADDPEGVRIERGVAFLEPGRAERGDLYFPASREPDVRSPAVVIIHGGGWTGGRRDASREINIGTTLARAGYVAFSVDYRLEAPGRWPTNVFDVKNAVRFLRANAVRYAIDPERIGAIGGSAGGHLALLIAYTAKEQALTPPQPYPNIRDDIRAVVDLYGISDPRIRHEIAPDGATRATLNPTGWKAVFGDRANLSEQDWTLSSPIEFVRRDVPPTLILHGTRDTTVEIEQSKTLCARLIAVGASAQLEIVDGAGHTFDLQTWNGKPLSRDLRPLVVGFFDRHMKAEIKTAPGR